MKKNIIAAVIGLFVLNAEAIEYDAVNGTKYEPSEIFFTNAKTGKKMDMFHKNGKTYVAGNLGDNYEINICSSYRHPSGRTLFIISVDGLNVISGETAGYNQSGYVVSNGSGCTKIKGWRKNMNEEARFVITSASGSYANKTNHDSRNIGVIGFAVFNEVLPVQPQITYQGATTNRMANAADSASGASAAPEARESAIDVMALKKEEKVGTGHGERVSSEAQKTEFKKARENPNRILKFYYDTYDNLVSKGIITPKDDSPNPFPGEMKFAPNPKN